MRAYAEELNRLNRERRASGDAWRAELVKVEKPIQGIVEAVKEGLFQRSMIAAMDKFEVRKEELTALLAEGPPDIPDMLPSASQLYAKKVAHLTEALNRPENRAEAAQALRGLIDRIVLRPGAKRGQIEATLYGELGTVLSWTAAQRD
jgi:site-specific DNA recombinase